MEELAVFGGPKAISSPPFEKWKRPKDLEKMVVENQLNLTELSATTSTTIPEFEKAFGSYIKSKYCLSFDHGTNALMAAYYAVGVGPGDEVITPAAGYIASYSGAMHLGARPIFCDIHPDTLLIDPESIKKKITPRTKAINIIHFNGRVCDLDAIFDISKHYGIPIIDDASHAHGAEWEGRKLGNFSHITCFSLQGVNPKGKPVGAGEGGAACTNTQEYYQKMLAYCQLHRTNLMQELEGSPYANMDKEILGLKWRPHPLAMALALISLKSLDYRNAKLLEHYHKVANCLKEFDFIKFPTTPAKAKLGGFYKGFKLIYEPSLLYNIPLTTLMHALLAEGVPLGKKGVAYMEHTRTLFKEGFDLWGNHRGPLNGSWLGLEPYQGCRSDDFPIAMQTDQTVLTLHEFIEIHEEYYAGLKKAFQKVHFHVKKL